MAPRETGFAIVDRNPVGQHGILGVDSDSGYVAARPFGWEQVVSATKEARMQSRVEKNNIFLTTMKIILPLLDPIIVMFM